MPNKVTLIQPGALVEDNDEPSGDELDDISARDIAMARYKRNHDYLSEIFTPYSAASIVPPPLEVPQRKEDLEKAIENEDKAICERTAEYDQRLKTLKQKQDDYWSLLTQLDKADNIEQLSATAEQFKITTGINLEHVKENVHAIPIPGLEQDEPPVPQTMQRQPGSTGSSRPGDHHQQNGYVADFMNAQQGGTDSNNGHHHQVSSSGPMNMFGSYAPSDSNTNQPVDDDDDNQNDFFDEMVNTGQDDDGGSVSEFLNADMDFEQTTATDKSVDGEPSNNNATTDVTMTEASPAAPSKPPSLQQQQQTSSLSQNKEGSSSSDPAAAAAAAPQLPLPTATTPSVPEASVPTAATANTSPSAPAQTEDGKPAEGNPQA
ncbi:hypothetical protein BDB00DRAFT_799864 [Zychaea mexicana]|uniref:uncharacterized protein n=1 Tax=Zychaea mexicana TaxID=64656 RepID=UPI0022FE8F61|nr:uncharacterized protein BDB00DRAFT_799864 [Zychaea mexicana]KAI9498332.1 hypothetical protein BDB00DRAFT_799864 [Zychaea mexicana]